MTEATQPEFVVSPSPHQHSGASVQRIMLDVILALVPALAASVWFFGLDAIRLVAVCVISCVLFELGARRLMKRERSVSDLSAVVTGLLLAFNLPPALPSWMAVVGAFAAIVIAKQLYGGLGYNPFNPALIGRVVLLVSFPVHMTTWSTWSIAAPATGVDAVTTATPLGLVKTAVGAGASLPFSFDSDTAWQFFLGIRNGCIGEVSALALLIGAAYLLYRRCIYWQVPVSYVAAVVLFSFILRVADPAHNLPPLFHLLTGGLIIGAFFMATDMVTSPVTKTGMLVFGAGCGVITMLIRKWGGYPEGVSFAILIMNALTPLINRGTRPRVFGQPKTSEARKQT